MSGKVPSVIQEHTVLKIIAPGTSTLVKNALKSLAAGALPQTPLGELYIPRMNGWKPWRLAGNPTWWTRHPWTNTHYSKSLHQMLPFQSKMQQNCCRLGLRPMRELTYTIFSKHISGLHTAFWPRDALLSETAWHYRPHYNAHSVSPPAR